MSKVFKQDQAQQCESWAHLEAQQRGAILTEASKKLAAMSASGEKAQRLFNHLLSQAQKLDEVNSLDGATGESNELYLAARGKTMVLGTTEADPIAFFGQLLAALLAGNEVILRYPSQQQLCEEATAILTEAGVYPGVMSIANDSPLTTLLHINRLAVVAAVGNLQQMAQIAKDLSESEGILTQLVSVTDLEGYSEMFEPDYLEHLCTERVKTVNTTAIGGNASLLELGTE